MCVSLADCMSILYCPGHAEWSRRDEWLALPGSISFTRQPLAVREKT